MKSHGLGIPGRDERGFTLVELLVVVIIIGVLAAIAIPRFLDRRQQAFNATAITDLRHLVTVETGLEGSAGLSEDPSVIADEGWAASDDRIVACADLSPSGDDVALAVWHLDGNTIYSWQRSSAVVIATQAAIPADCASHTGGTDVS